MPILPETGGAALAALLSGGISRREFLRLSTAGVSAAPGEADIGGGVMAPGWLINGSLPSPPLRVRRGEWFDVTMLNQLEEQFILQNAVTQRRTWGSISVGVRPERYRSASSQRKCAGCGSVHGSPRTLSSALPQP